MRNRTRYTTSYPRTIFLASKWLQRSIEEYWDELKFNADALNVALVELQRMQEVLGSRAGYEDGDPLEFMPFFGDGSDGNQTFDGTTTLLTRDTYYNNLTLRNNAEIVTNGFRLFVRDTLLIENGSFISFNGADAVDENGAPAVGTGGVLDDGRQGASGGINDGDGLFVAFTDGGSGGAGGDGTVGLGGAGGLAATFQSEWILRDVISILGMFTGDSIIQTQQGGLGGGGGGGDGTSNFGGGGGGGAGVMMVAANRVAAHYDPTAMSPVIPFQAMGGDGADGETDSGGGGGGGGGILAVLSHLVINLFDDTLDIPLDAIMDVSGGQGGTGTNNGVSGDPGKIYDVRI